MLTTLLIATLTLLAIAQGLAAFDDRSFRRRATGRLVELWLFVETNVAEIHKRIDDSCHTRSLVDRALGRKAVSLSSRLDALESRGCGPCLVVPGFDRCEVCELIRRDEARHAHTPERAR